MDLQIDTCFVCSMADNIPEREYDEYDNEYSFFVVDHPKRIDVEYREISTKTEE